MPNDQTQGALDNEAQITLALLNALESNSGATQRGMAQDLGIALGLANAYLKRCVRKGYVKISQAPRKRYFYYLTPTGFAEKSRLTAEFLSQSFNFFRLTRSQCADILAHCAERKWERIALYGLGDLCEIATLCAAEYPVQLLGIVDPLADTDQHAGLPVASSLSAFQPLDAVIVTDLKRPQDTFDRLCAQLPADQVLTPGFLNVSRQRPQLAE